MLNVNFFRVLLFFCHCTIVRTKQNKTFIFPFELSNDRTAFDISMPKRNEMKTIDECCSFISFLFGFFLPFSIFFINRFSIIMLETYENWILLFAPKELMTVRWLEYNKWLLCFSFSLTIWYQPHVFAHSMKFVYYSELIDFYCYYPQLIYLPDLNFLCMQTTK